jgi:hypothetical protein
LQVTNKYGSPDFEELRLFAKDLNKKLIAELGEDEAGTFEIVTSSPVRPLCSSSKSKLMQA